MSVDKYGTILLFATGLGIAGQLPYLKEVMEGYQKRDVKTRRVALFWEIESEAHKDWVEDMMNDLLSLDIEFILEINVFVLGEFKEDTTLLGDVYYPHKRNPNEPYRVIYNYSAMNVETLLQQELQEHTGRAVLVSKTDRFEALVDELPYPANQYPSLLVLMGNVGKSLAFSELTTAKTAKRSLIADNLSGIHLTSDPRSHFSDRPVLIADGDLPKSSSGTNCYTTMPPCHQTHSHPMYWAVGDGSASTDSNIIGQVYSQLLYPFTDVYCIFAEDLGGIEEVAYCIAEWMRRPSASSTTAGTTPQVLVVTENSGDAAEEEKKSKTLLLQGMGENGSIRFYQRFSGLSVVNLARADHISLEARYRRLKEHLMSKSDEVRSRRQLSSTLLSALHFRALFRHARNDFTTGHEARFDFVTAARYSNPVAVDLEQHLSNFIQSIKWPELTDFAIESIASSLLLDSYPPSAPLFDPRSVFNTLYRDTCFQAITKMVGEMSNTRLLIIRHLEDKFQQLFDIATKEHMILSSQLHRNLLASNKSIWSALTSYETCLVCLRRRPQYRLPCGHSMCENCVKVFGEQSPGDPWLLGMRQCLLCDSAAGETKVRIHPPTAGVGILCIDGGGVRGVLPLKFMQILHERIALPLPIQRLFKVVFGVSSGGLIALALYINGWSLDECTRSFESLAKVAFTKRKLLKIPIISKIQHLVVSYLSDCIYPAANIESALTSTFGSSKSILDISHATPLGTRIGIPVSTIRKPSLCVFTNYNGIGVRDQDCGYHVLQPKKGDVPVWKIARSASAAPGFFRTKDIEGVGTFQDAGTIENNPVGPALSETEAMFPLVEEPDYVVSLGTGGPRCEASAPDTSGSRGLVRDGFISRAFRAFWESMRGKRAWKTLTGSGRTKSSGKYHRLDIEFDGPEPRLDDVESIPNLQSKVAADTSISKVVDNIARCAIASLFYFELDSIPKHINGKYVGSGSIFCVLCRRDPAFAVLIQKLAKGNGAFVIGDCRLPGAFGDESCFDKDGNFQKHVVLSVHNKFSVFLREGNLNPCNISGSPFVIEKMVIAQGLDADMGLPDHRKRRRNSDCGLPSPKRIRVSTK
ncbi:MAG: hypothetical protein M1821_004664 [Bathelium mastoideum]|nr:MAG: hypothetical protein M1821_004664 [Bathelium mastoideum]